MYQSGAVHSTFVQHERELEVRRFNARILCLTDGSSLMALGARSFSVSIYRALFSEFSPVLGSRLIAIMNHAIGTYFYSSQRMVAQVIVPDQLLIRGWASLGVLSGRAVNPAGGETASDVPAAGWNCQPHGDPERNRSTCARERN